MNIANVYNHFSHELVPKRRTRTHKASELKEVYNIGRDTALSIIDDLKSFLK